ncbi:MAG: hypothetical protein KJO91_03010 [Gammaproteobacteria bacterium]|nr:hypothetical protein [Gammaproteobacteria bacterium]
MQNGSIKIDRSSERSFGIVFSVIFILFGLYRLWVTGDVLWWVFAAAIALLTVTFTKPTLLKKPNYWWFKFGMLLGSIIAPIVMGLVYITTLVPMGLFIRLSGKDILNLKLDRNSDSYWIKRESPPQPMKNQF